jgi:hypothetical protein
MSTKPRKVASISKQQDNHVSEHPQINLEMVLPPGTVLDDFFITSQDVMSQLKVGKRKLNNMRRDGEISYTLFGKTVMYLKQELAAMLKARIIIGKKSILKQLNVDLFKTATSCYWLLAMLSDNLSDATML